MGLLVQQWIVGVGEAVTMIGVVCTGLTRNASTVSSMPLAPMITDPTMKD
jgi:hypothetical protein